MTESINILLWPFVILAAFLVLFAVGNAAVCDDYDEDGWFIYANRNRELSIKIITIAFLVSIYCLFFAESGDWLSSALKKITGISSEYVLGIISAIGILGLSILLGRCLYEIAYFGSRVRAFSLSDNIDRYISSIDDEESKMLADNALKGFVRGEPQLVMDRIMRAKSKARKKRIAKAAKQKAEETSIVVTFPQGNAINQ